VDGRLEVTSELGRLYHQRSVLDVGSALIQRCPGNRHGMRSLAGRLTHVNERASQQNGGKRN
jgi:hypothetical protein